jgi:hypothetical protein
MAGILSVCHFEALSELKDSRCKPLSELKDFRSELLSVLKDGSPARGASKIKISRNNPQDARGRKAPMATLEFRTPTQL